MFRCAGISIFPQVFGNLAAASPAHRGPVKLLSDCLGVVRMCVDVDAYGVGRAMYAGTQGTLLGVVLDSAAFSALGLMLKNEATCSPSDTRP